jgi:glycine C-acetyltransferase
VKEENKGGALIITEGVFGMHGELGNLRDVCALKNKYGARLFVDDAHGFGVMGANGHGTGEHFGVQDQIDLYYGTFTKAFALLGGVAAAPKEVTSYIKFNSRTSIFSRSLPLVLVQAIAAAVDVAIAHPENRARMWHVAHKLQNGLRELGFDLGKTESPVTPVYVPSGDTLLAIQMTHLLRDEYNIFVTPVTYPVVQKGVTLYRLIPTAAHTDEEVDLTLKAFKEVRDRLKLKL